MPVATVATAARQCHCFRHLCNHHPLPLLPLLLLLPQPMFLPLLLPLVGLLLSTLLLPLFSAAIDVATDAAAATPASASAVIVATAVAVTATLTIVGSTAAHTCRLGVPAEDGDSEHHSQSPWLREEVDTFAA
jgi:hypothetical protein